MKHRFTNTLFLFLFLCYPSEGIAQEYFEGIISYTVESKLKYEDHEYNDYLCQKYGDRLEIYYFKDGSFKRDYRGIGREMGFDWFMYDKPTHNLYGKWIGIDTIFVYDARKNPLLLKSMLAVEDKVILGKARKGLVTELFDPEFKEKISFYFYFDNSLKLAPDAYTDYNDAYMDKVYEKSQSHYIGLFIDNELLNTYMEAVKIERKELDRSVLEIPDKWPVVRK